MCLQHSLVAQDADTKFTLLKKINESKDDTAKVLRYISIGQLYENGNLDSAAFYYKKAGNLSELLNYNFGRLKYIFNYTYLLNVQSKYDESLALNLKGIGIAQLLGNENELGKAYNNTGSVYININDLKNAVQYFLKAETLFEKVGNKQALGQLYNNLSAAFHDLKQYQRGYEYGNKGSTLARQIKDDYSIAQGLLNGANSLTKLRRYPEAKMRLEEAIAINRKMNDLPSLTNSLLSIGDLYQQQNKFEVIKPFYDEALALSKENVDQRSIATSFIGLAGYYFFTKNFEHAALFADSALLVAEKNGLKDMASQCWRFQASLAAQKGDMIGYSRALTTADSIDNIIFNDKIVLNTQELEVQYQTEKKEQQLKLQLVDIRQKNMLTWLLGGGLLAAILISFLVFRNSQQKRKIQQQRIAELETEKKLLATEAILKGAEDERSRLAKDLHDGLGGMLSGIKFSFTTIKANQVLTEENALAFERSMNMLDSSIKELRMVAHNLMPESLVKFGLDTALNDFCNYIQGSGVLHINYHSFGMQSITLAQNTEIILYRIIQELVNNVIKHAQAQHVIVQLQADKTQLSITVEDDGKGMDQAAIDAAKGIGWGNIKSRVEYLKGSISIASEVGKGTSVNIEMAI